MDWLLGFWPILERRIYPRIGQPLVGFVRFIFSFPFLFFFMRLNGIVESGRESFTCSPGTDDYHTEECFLNYSAKMNPVMRPYFFLLGTAGILVPLWAAIILHGIRCSSNIRTGRDAWRNERLCHEFRKKFLLHVACEAMVVALILWVFCCTQKIFFPETYNCTPTMICRDSKYQDKTSLNIFIVGGMGIILLLCIGTVYQVMCYNVDFEELFVSRDRD